ncbi:hypothetical protein WG66_005164 [Moniliophthora roreri]|nr:hypothetical protein WG66_005164 [Moniliophthora roreri]
MELFLFVTVLVELRNTVNTPCTGEGNFDFIQVVKFCFDDFNALGSENFRCFGFWVACNTTDFEFLGLPQEEVDNGAPLPGSRLEHQRQQ